MGKLSSSQMPTSHEELAAVYIGWLIDRDREFGSWYQDLANCLSEGLAKKLITSSQAVAATSLANERLESMGELWTPHDMVAQYGFMLHAKDHGSPSGFIGNHILGVEEGHLYYGHKEERVNESNGSSHTLEVFLKGDSSIIRVRYKGTPQVPAWALQASKDMVRRVPLLLPPVLRQGLEVMVSAVEAYQG